MAGGDIVMEAVSRHHAGTYQCVTRDDYGLEPVTKEVELFVECKLYQHRNICLINISFLQCFKYLTLCNDYSGVCILSVQSVRNRIVRQTIGALAV